MDQASEHPLDDIDPRLWSLRLREDDRSAESAEEAEVLSFVPATRDRGGEVVRDRGPGGKRDWSAALELVREASEAIRMSEDRATELEAKTQDLLQRFREELKSAQVRIAASEKRAEEAEGRARDAEARMRDSEEWLARFHDAILDGFSAHLSMAPNGRVEDEAERVER